MWSRKLLTHPTLLEMDVKRPTIVLENSAVLGDHFATADDYRLVHEALHQHLAMSIRGRHRIVVDVIADQLSELTRDRGL